MSQPQQIDISFIRLNKYCDLSGVTPNTIYEYVKKGEIKEGVEFVRKKGKYWINVKAFERWLATSSEA